MEPGIEPETEVRYRTTELRHNKILVLFFNISAIYEAIYLIPILIVRKFKGNKEKLGMFDDYGRKFLST